MNRFVVLVSLGSLLFGCSELDDFSTTRSSLSVGTYNAGLAYGFVPFAEERREPVFEQLANQELDVLCLQELWESRDWNEVAGSGAWSDNYRLPASQGEVARCSAEEIDPLATCARAECDGVSTDMLVGCVTENCGAALGGLGDQCFGCVTSLIGNDIDTIVDRCGPQGSGGGGSFAYEGSFGIGLVSTMPIRHRDALVLESTTNRRGVLYGLFAGTAIGNVHVFCTHLTANLTSLPYTGSAASWADEQAMQADRLLAWVEEKVGEDEPVVILGDLNAGPSVGALPAELADNYQKYLVGGFNNPYTSSPQAQCTICDDNPLRADHSGPGGSIIDHILTRDISSTFNELPKRVIDQEIQITIDGQSQTSAYSDHYGVALEFTPMSEL